MKILISISMFILLTYIANAQNTVSSTPDTLKTLVIKVAGFDCSGDLSGIKTKLINHEGIDACTYTDAGTFTVQYHTSVVNEKRLKEVIEKLPSCDNPNVYPYKAKMVKVKTKNKKR